MGIQIFREHHIEADVWAGKGVKGPVGEWVDTANVVWSEVTGLCGFRDGSCESGTCGAGTVIRVPIHKKCGPVRGRSSLDAELGGCGLLIEILNQWINKNTPVDRYRAPQPRPVV